MILAAMEIPSVDTFINYGCFGLVVLICCTVLFKFLPAWQKASQDERKETQASFNTAITKLVDEFRDEQHECREERMRIAKEAASEREKDRAARHETNNVLQKLLIKLGEA